MFFEFQTEREINFLQNNVKMNLVQSKMTFSEFSFLRINYYEVRCR